MPESINQAERQHAETPRIMNTGTTLKSTETKAVVALLVILIATIYSYHSVLNDFFHGDDFVHLSWLSHAVKEPELIWRNFHSAWLDISTAKFYRPLISLFMVSDYLLWHGNGLGFHITNLLCHLLNTVLLWLIISNFARGELGLAKPIETNFYQVQTWALASAALFALYPIHPEAVSWITGRVDSIVTMFALGSIWCYMRWRLSKRYGWIIASSLSFVLALLSKEMAVVVPAVLTLYELIYMNNPSESGVHIGLSIQSKVQSLYSSLLKTSFLWLILVAYFFVRRLALGTFVGGYDDSLFAIPSKTVFVKNWLHSINMTLVPMNKNIFGAHNPLKIIWIILLVVSVISSLRVLSTQPQKRRHVVFLMGWLILSLLPIFKLFNIGDDLQGSRLIYFGSAPLCALICFGFANLGYSNVTDDAQSHLLWRTFKYVMLSTILSLSALVLTANNFAWEQAGQASHAVVQQLDKFYKATVGDPPVYLVGLPDNISGAFVCRNAIEGMTKFPQISRSVNNCFMLTSTEHSFPYGFARDSIQKDKNSKILQWNSEPKDFDLLTLPQDGDSSRETIQSDTISFPATTLPNKYIIPFLLQVPQIKKTAENQSLILLVQNLPCWSTDIITLKCRILSPPQPDSEFPISLMYTNDLQKEFSLSKRVATIMKNTSAEQTISFPLHGDIDWSMGGNCHQLQILSSNKYVMKIDKLESTPLLSMMPKLSFSNTANQNKLGYVQLNRQYQSCQFNFDAEPMSPVTSVSLEVSKPNTFFDTPNSEAPDNHVAITHSYAGKKGRISLRLQDFPVSGIYQARLRAFDSQKNPYGFAGDQIMITVSK
jgi:hypothetical protein